MTNLSPLRLSTTLSYSSVPDESDTFPRRLTPLSSLPMSRSGEERAHFEWLHSFKLDFDGLSYSLPGHVSRLALTYSDIFETGANPERGGHGISILFRYEFGRHRKGN